MAKDSKKPFIGRRYLSTREKGAYILADYAGGLDMGDMGEMYLSRVLDLDLNARAFIQTFIVGPWDTVNDILFAGLVEKTRTRFGKFKPYMFLCHFSGLPLKMFYYSLPLLFWNTPPAYPPKVISYAVFCVLSETIGTFGQLSGGAFFSTLTPNMYERSNLIVLVNFINNYTGKKLPGYVLSLIVTGLNFSSRAESEIVLKLRNLYAGFGMATASVGFVLGLFYIIIARERIPQSIKQPSLLDSMKALINNRLLLVMSLSTLLQTFSIGLDGEYTYYNAVLKFPLGSTVAGIPGALTGNLAWLFIPKARERFSTRTLWIVGTHSRALLGIAVYFIGLIGGAYRHIWMIMPILAVWEAIYSPMIPLRNVVVRDMNMECMDYSEWKTGHRNEALISVAMNFASKIALYVFQGVNLWLRAKMGFKTGVDYVNQDVSVQRFVWASFTFYPAITGNILSMIPKFFYNLSKEERDRMGKELMERRSALAAEQTRVADDVNEELRVEN